MDGRYVVGIDGSSPSEAALAWASYRAERDGRPVVLAHVDEGPGPGDPERGESRDLLRDRVTRIRALYPRVSFATTLAHGSAVWELARLTRHEDVLAVGTHKTGYLNGRVLGSRSVQITMATDCTVVVVPDVDLRFRKGVVVGIDRQETAVSLARIAAQEASDMGCELLVVHCAAASAGLDYARLRFDLPIASAVEAAQADFPALLVRSRVSERTPVNALLDAARGKALLVLGPGSLDPSRSPLGSVMHDVLLNANAPVLIARSLVDGARDVPVAAARAFA
jgi:nucleotide-binding universal stress UspA family protein